jgi:hypothetical protein
MPVSTVAFMISPSFPGGDALNDGFKGNHGEKHWEPSIIRHGEATINNRKIMEEN